MTRGHPEYNYLDEGAMIEFVYVYPGLLQIKNNRLIKTV